LTVAAEEEVAVGADSSEGEGTLSLFAQTPAMGIVSPLSRVVYRSPTFGSTGTTGVACGSAVLVLILVSRQLGRFFVVAAEEESRFFRAQPPETRTVSPFERVE
jgi:hypothetical protein